MDFLSVTPKIIYSYQNIFLQLAKYFFPTGEKYFANWKNFGLQLYDFAFTVEGYAHLARNQTHSFSSETIVF